MENKEFQRSRNNINIGTIINKWYRCIVVFFIAFYVFAQIVNWFALAHLDKEFGGFRKLMEDHRRIAWRAQENFKQINKLGGYRCEK